MTARRLVTVNELGRRIGEDHPRAVLTNHEVDLLLRMHEAEGYGYKRLAEKFGISKSAARDICVGRNRCQSPAAFRPAAP